MVEILKNKFHVRYMEHRNQYELLEGNIDDYVKEFNEPGKYHYSNVYVKGGKHYKYTNPDGEEWKIFISNGKFDRNTLPEIYESIERLNRNYIYNKKEKKRLKDKYLIEKNKYFYPLKNICRIGYFSKVFKFAEKELPKRKTLFMSRKKMNILIKYSQKLLSIIDEYMESNMLMNNCERLLHRYNDTLIALGMLMKDRSYYKCYYLNNIQNISYDKIYEKIKVGYRNLIYEYSTHIDILNEMKALAYKRNEELNKKVYEQINGIYDHKLPYNLLRKKVGEKVLIEHKIYNDRESVWNMFDESRL